MSLRWISRPPRRRQGGYVLLIALAGLLLLSLLAARLDAVATALRETVQSRLDLHQRQAELQGLLDRVLWHMLTRPLGMQGFGVGSDRLWIDGRATTAGDGWWLSLQDVRGLASLNFTDAVLLRRFMQLAEVSDEETDALLDVLADYSDADALRHLHGAEAPEYARLGLPPPRNDWLMSPYELHNMPRWRDHPDLVARLTDYATTHSEGWINVNTAPAALLEAMPGATPEGVARLLERRRSLPYTDAASLRAETGILLPDEDSIRFYPGLFYRLRLWNERDYPAWELVLMLTPNYADRPYQILDARTRPRPEESLDPDSAPRLPPPQSDAEVGLAVESP